MLLRITTVCKAIGCVSVVLCLLLTTCFPTITHAQQWENVGFWQVESLIVEVGRGEEKVFGIGIKTVEMPSGGGIPLIRSISARDSNRESGGLSMIKGYHGLTFDIGEFDIVDFPGQLSLGEVGRISIRIRIYDTAPLGPVNLPKYEGDPWNRSPWIDLAINEHMWFSFGVVVTGISSSSSQPPLPPQTITTVIITTASPPQTATAGQPTASALVPGPDLTLIAVTVVAVGAIIGLVVYALSMRRRTSRPLSVAEVTPAGLFEVSVSVPSVGKTVTLEVAPDHTVGSLVDTLMSTLELPKSKRCVLDYAGKLIGQQDFGKSLAALGIKEGSKLSLRVVD